MVTQSEKVARWLAASGVRRSEAVAQAARELLDKYHTRCGNVSPVNLTELAATLGVKIRVVGNLQGEARFLPVTGGFVILVSDRCRHQTRRSWRYRTLIAHELAHILFYGREETIPVRIGPASSKEEKFCFDVARRLLVPDWSVATLRLKECSDPGAILDALTQRLHVSKPVAAAVMLQDYHLACGVAGRWNRERSAWTLSKHDARASSCLAEADRRALWASARRWLMAGAQPGSDCRVIGRVELRGEAAFVAVVLDRRCSTTASGQGNGRRIGPEGGDWSHESLFDLSDLHNSGRSVAGK